MNYIVKNAPSIAPNEEAEGPDHADGALVPDGSFVCKICRRLMSSPFMAHHLSFSTRMTPCRLCGSILFATPAEFDSAQAGLKDAIARHLV